MIKLHLFRQWSVGIAFGAAFIGFGILAQPSWSADKLTAKYGPFYRSLLVSDLQQYAETGIASPELSSFLNLVKGKQKDSLRKVLNLKMPFDVVTVDKLLKSPMADQLLTKVSDVTILPGRFEKEALRSAIIVSAASKEGLGTMGILKSYPTQTLTVDLKKMLKLLKESKGGIPGLGGMGGSMGLPGGTSTPEPVPSTPPDK